MFDNLIIMAYLDKLKFICEKTQRKNGLIVTATSPPLAHEVKTKTSITYLNYGVFIL